MKALTVGKNRPANKQAPNLKRKIIMDNKALYTKTMRFQRVAVENTFSFFAIMQNYGEQVLKESLNQNTWIPEKGKKTFHCLANTCSIGAKFAEKIAQRNFIEMEKIYDATEKQWAKGPQVKKSNIAKPAQTNEKASARSGKSILPEKAHAKKKDFSAKAEVQKKSPKRENPPITVTPEVKVPVAGAKEIDKKKPLEANLPAPLQKIP